MRKYFSLAALGLSIILYSQEQVSFENDVATIDSLVINGAFELADQKLTELQTSIENTSLAEQDTVRLYFSSKRAFIASRLGDCVGTIASSKEDVALKQEVYGPGDPLTLTAKRNLGVYYLNCDSLELAQSILKETLDTHKTEIGTPDGVYARTLDDLAFLEGKLGNLEQAISLYDELVDLLSNNKVGFYFHVIENYSALLISNEQYEAAAHFFDDLKTSMQDKPEYPIFLRDYYNVFVHLNDYRRALEVSSALSSWCQENNTICEDVAISQKEFKWNSARLATLLFRYDEAETYYRDIERLVRNTKEYPQVLLEQADLYSYTSKRFNQLTSLNKVITYHRANFTTDSTTYEQAVFKLGTLYALLGRFAQANELFQNYIVDLESNGTAPPNKLATAYQSLGNQRLLLQDFKDADSYFSKAKKILEDNNLVTGKEYASLLNSYGALYETLANFDQAERYYRNALSISSEEESTLRTTLASNLANILIRVNPSNDSIEYYLTKAIDWQQSLSGENHPNMANLLASRGVYFLKSDLTDKALDDLKKACEVFEYTVTEDHPQYLSAYSNLGLVYDAKKQDELAESTLLEMADLYRKYYDKTNPGYIRALNNLANYYARTGNYSNAEPLYVELAQVQIDEIANSFTYLSESEKKSFVSEKQKLLNNFKNYVVARTLNEEEVNQEVIEKWYNLELSTKGILLNATRKVRENIFNSGDTELIELFSEWTLARKQIADLQSLKSANNAENELQYDSLNQKINDLEKELTRRSSEFSASFNQKAPTYSDLRSHLGMNEAIVEIIRTEINGEGVYSALIGTSQAIYPDLIVIGKGEELEERGFNAYKNSISYKVASSRSFEVYWQKIDDYLSKASITRIYYSPDGVYHKLNPNTFYHPTKEEYLIDELDIVQLSSTKDILTRTSFSELRPTNALLVGRPAFKNSDDPFISSGPTRSFQLLSNVSDLPGTEEEIVEINGLFKKKDLTVDVLLKEDAKEEEIKKMLNSELVHIATHGFFLADENEVNDPMLNSGLLLAGVSNDRKNQSDDGILTAYEIMNLNLSNLNLVVLSACETGLGEVASGEGIYGLQRAFFVGGAQTLIMSLWKVDDTATRDLMIEFYKEYLKDGNRKEAFAQAQRKMKKKYKDPVYWGAFVMIGS